MDDPTYEVIAVPVTSIAMVSYDVIKVPISAFRRTFSLVNEHPQFDLAAIVEKHKKSVMNGVIESLKEVLHGWLQKGSVPEASWGRNRQLEFQDLLRQRQHRMRQLKKVACTSCPKFDEHVIDFHDPLVLRP